MAHCPALLGKSAAAFRLAVLPAKLQLRDRPFRGSGLFWLDRAQSSEQQLDQAVFFKGRQCDHFTEKRNSQPQSWMVDDVFHDAVAITLSLVRLLQCSQPFLVIIQPFFMV